MPGKSKKGGGLETKKSAFYLRSGNNPPFKQMGSIPMTRSQAARLQERQERKGRADQPLAGESKYKMKRRQRLASEYEGTLQKPEDIGARTGKEFVESGKEFLGGLVKTVTGLKGDIFKKGERSSERTSRRTSRRTSGSVITDHDANWNYQKVDGRWQTQKKDGDGNWIDIQDNEEARAKLDEAYPE